eukprot:s300_g7.t1
MVVPAYKTGVSNRDVFRLGLSEVRIAVFHLSSFGWRSAWQEGCENWLQFLTAAIAAQVEADRDNLSTGKEMMKKKRLKLKKKKMKTIRLDGFVPQRHPQGKNEASLKVLKMALGGCDTNIVTQAFACWKSQYTDAKDEAELEAAMRENDKVIQENFDWVWEYKSKHNKAAEAAMNRAARFYEENLLLEMIDSSVEGTVTRNQGKVDAKRQQLASVHQMFRSFAQQLESSLKKSVESEKLERTAPLRRTRTLHKMDTGSVSLPDIHKPTSPSLDHWKAEVGQPRTAWG